MVVSYIELVTDVINRQLQLFNTFIDIRNSRVIIKYQHYELFNPRPKHLEYSSMKNIKDKYFLLSIKYVTVQIHCYFAWLFSISAETKQDKQRLIVDIGVFSKSHTRTNQSSRTTSAYQAVRVHFPVLQSMHVFLCVHMYE